MSTQSMPAASPADERRPVASPRRRLLRGVVLAAGVGLAVLAVAGHRLGLSSSPGLGSTKLMMLGVAAVLTLFAIVPRRSAAERVLHRLTLLGAAMYATLLAGEIVLRILTPPPPGGHSAQASLKGLYRPDDAAGFDLVPGWSGTFDDGLVQCEIVVNSRAARDDEPGTADPGDTGVLLVGDSFTFGYCLDQSETIDKFIERRSEGTVDAYNLGVGGYGPGSVLEKFRKADWWTGTDVFYLFFNNDLRDDNADPKFHTVYGGYVVPRLKPDGTAYTTAEYEETVAAVEGALTEPEPRPARTTAIKAALTLRQLRQRATTILGSDDILLAGAARRYHADYVRPAVAHTRQMDDLARRRGLRFHVVVLPSKGETGFGRYASFTRQYVDGVKAAGLHVVELMDRLTPDDYFVHDGHFSPAGADVAAGVILETIDREMPSDTP